MPACTLAHSHNPMCTHTQGCLYTHHSVVRGVSPQSACVCLFVCVVVITWCEHGLWTPVPGLWRALFFLLILWFFSDPHAAEVASFLENSRKVLKEKTPKNDKASCFPPLCPFSPSSHNCFFFFCPWSQRTNKHAGLEWVEGSAWKRWE